MNGAIARPEMRGEAPIGMPEPLVQTLQVVRDALYLAAHDSQWVTQSCAWLREMFTALAASSQIEILRRGDWPAAFLCWSHLTVDAEKRLIGEGVSALSPSDVVGGRNTWLIGIAAPWRREDFDMLMVYAARNLCGGAGGWHTLMPGTGDMPPRVMEFTLSSEGRGRLVEVPA